MDIRFVSSLGHEQEEQIAHALIAVLGRLLDDTSVTYALRIRTASEQVFEKRHPTLGEADHAPYPPGDLRNFA